jgi:S1-C subfamily serine protease
MFEKETKRHLRSACTSVILSILFLLTCNEHANSLTKDEKDKLTTARTLGKAFVEVAKKVQPAVVNITTEKTVATKPWEKYGDDFFKGSPFEEFFRGFWLLSPRKRKGKSTKTAKRGIGSDSRQGRLYSHQ